MCMAVPATLLQYHTVWLVTGPPPCRRSESERQKERGRAHEKTTYFLLLKWNREKEEKPILLNNKNIFFSFYTWPKTINAATSLLYCRFVHGTVHLLYCINTHTLTVFTVYFHILDFRKDNVLIKIQKQIDKPIIRGVFEIKSDWFYIGYMGCIGDKTILFFATDSGNKGLYCIKITTISVQY